MRKSPLLLLLLLRGQHNIYRTSEGGNERSLEGHLSILATTADYLGYIDKDTKYTLTTYLILCKSSVVWVVL